MRFINEDDQALLMTGSTDGTIKMFRDYDSHDRVHLVSALRALTDMVPSTHNAGLVFDWLQGRGRIIVAGDAKVIRVWNAATETCTNVSSALRRGWFAVDNCVRAGYPRSLRLVCDLAHF